MAGVPGEDAKGVMSGIEFLNKVNKDEEHMKLSGKTVVIGGGNVAIDVARAAVRLGAKTTIVYRRDRDAMPAADDEVEEAIAEGVKFMFLASPVEITGEGKAETLKVEVMELKAGKPVGTGKFETLPVSAVISAIGQKIDLNGMDFATGAKGTVNVSMPSYQTSVADVFAGGDVVTGPKFAIDAIAAGREGAISLHRYVHEGQSLTLARDPREFYELDKKQAVVPIECFDAPARQTVAHDASKAKTFSNDRITFTEAQVKAEASRCLGCGVSIVDQNKCIGCGLCTTRCEFDAIHLTRDVPEASRMYRTEDKMKAILPHMVKRAAKLTIKDIKGKRAK